MGTIHQLLRCFPGHGAKTLLALNIHSFSQRGTEAICKADRGRACQAQMMATELPLTCQQRHGCGLPSTVVAQEDCYLSFIEVQGQVSDAHLVLITHLEHL